MASMVGRVVMAEVVAAGEVVEVEVVCAARLQTLKTMWWLLLLLRPSPACLVRVAWMAVSMAAVVAAMVVARVVAWVRGCAEVVDDVAASQRHKSSWLLASRTKRRRRLASSRELCQSH